MAVNFIIWWTWCMHTACWLECLDGFLTMVEIKEHISGAEQRKGDSFDRGGHTLICCSCGDRLTVESEMAPRCAYISSASASHLFLACTPASPSPPLSLVFFLFFCPCCAWPDVAESNCGPKTTFNDYFIWVQRERSHRRALLTKEAGFFSLFSVVSPVLAQQRILLTQLRLKHQNK